MDGAPACGPSDVTVPLMKPLFVILISLSIIWDFQAFTQIWIMLDETGA